jgi:hypothetical protein
MSEQAESDPGGSAPPNNALSDDLLWGVAAIGREIARSPRQTFHLLENQKIPAAKVCNRWCASRSALRQFFAKKIAGEARIR